MAKPFKELHERAIRHSRQYHRYEMELIRDLEQIDASQGYREMKYARTRDYAMAELDLSKDVAYNLITVARKIREVPALLEKLEARKITLTNARIVSTVMTAENQGEWLPIAELSKN